MAESYSVEAILSARDTNFTSTMQSAQGAMGNLAKASSGFMGTIKGVASGMGVFKVASMAIGSVTGSIGDAVSRVDTLANSTRVFENMGYGATETANMMEALNDSILGLPTPLNDALSGVQLLASSMDDIGKSQEVFSAMNNAILGFGGTVGMVDNAIVQLSQAFSNGAIDGQTWNSMINSGLGPTLKALAREMGYTTGELKEYLSDGTISVEEFQDALIDLNENGGGGLKSLQQIAQDSTKGIATSLANARTAITRGVGNIIEAIDTGLSNAGLGSISEIITGIGKVAERMLTGLAGRIEKLGTFLAPLVEGFKSVMGPIEEATDAVGAFQSATDELTGSVADVTSIFDEWDSLSLEEKQATVNTMGQDDLEELMNLLGVDFENIPDEYTKNAYLNAYGKDALEELLWVTGKWHDLTFEEKRAVLEAQLENDELKEAIELGGLWDDTEFYSKLAEINMNDNDAEQQVLDLINHYRELDGQKPIEIEVDTKKVVEGGEDLKDFSDSVDSANKGTKGFVKEFVKSSERLKRSTIKLKRGFDDAFESFQNGDYERGIFDLGNSVATFFQDGINNAGFTLAGIFDTINANYSYEDWQEIGKAIGGLISGGLKLFFENGFEFDFSGIRKALNSLDSLMEEALNGIFDGLLESIGLEGEIADIENFLSGITFEGDLSAWAESIKQAFKDSFADWDWNILLPEFGYTDLKGNKWKLDWNKAIERIVSGFGDSPIDETIVMFELVPEIQIGDFNTDFREEFASKFINEDMYTEQQIDVITSYVIDDEGNLNAELVAMMEAQGLDPQQVTVPTIVDFILENIEELGLYDVIQEILGGGTPDFEVEYTVPVKPEVEVIEPDSDWKNYFEDNPMGEIQGSADLKIIPTSTTVTPTGQPTFDTGGVDLSTTTDQTVEVIASNGSVQVMSMSIDENGLPILEPIDMTDELAITGTADTSGVNVGGIAQTLQTQIETAMTSIGEMDLSGVTTGITEGLTSTFAEIDFTSAFSGFTQGFSQITAEVSASMSQIQSAVSSGMRNVTRDINTTTQQMGASFQNGAQSAISAVQGMVSSIIGAVSGLAGQMQSAGAMAGQGLANGLRSSTGAVASAAAALAIAASSAVKSALSIASPSKLFHQFGVFVGRGLADGMQSSKALVSKAGTMLAEATKPTFGTGQFRLGRNNTVSIADNSNLMNEVVKLRRTMEQGQSINIDGYEVGRTQRDYNDRNLARSNRLNDRWGMAY